MGINDFATAGANFINISVSVFIARVCIFSAQGGVA